VICSTTLAHGTAAEIVAVASGLGPAEGSPRLAGLADTGAVAGGIGPAEGSPRLADPGDAAQLASGRTAHNASQASRGAPRGLPAADHPLDVTFL
jgi:hypothetical protein